MVVNLIENKILLDMKAKDSRGAIEELVSLIPKTFAIDKKGLVEDLIEREQLGSTGIGKGIAIPHVKTDALEEIVVAFGRSRKGVDFNALDDKPVHLFFLIAAPENDQRKYLNTLARISRMLKNEKLKGRLLKARLIKEIIALFGEKEG